MRSGDITGVKFGRLTALRFVGKSRWHCVCECGAERSVMTARLRSGETKSCGCLRRQSRAPAPRPTHRLSKTRTYQVWADMKRRCLNPKVAHFVRYGGRGITVCDRWATFENFLADMGEAPAGMSLDRIDNNAGYSPENCRWATALEQAGNTSRNVRLEVNGQTHCISEWARIRGLHPATISCRLKRGLSAQQAVLLPGRKS